VAIMPFAKKLLRPFYKKFLEMPLWWFLKRVKAYFLAEIGPQLESTAHRLAVIEARLNALDGNNVAQWSALEQLLLALYRQPEEYAERQQTANPRQERVDEKTAG